MRVFLYECITGGGWFDLAPGEVPAGSLYREGQAMVSALADDLQAIQGCDLLLLRDGRLDACPNTKADVRRVMDSCDHRRAFDDAVTCSDGVIIIAPEWRNCLLERVQRVVELRGNLHSPDPSFVAVTSDKHQTVGRLQEAGVRVPVTQRIESDRQWRHALGSQGSMPGPFVIKPCDGAGSMGLRFFPHALSGQAIDRLLSDDAFRSGTWCVQAYCAGRPASVSAIMQGERFSLLPPCWQHLDPETWVYTGGAAITETDYAERARRLAEKALAALPPTRGYVGVDLILGNDDRGDEDFVLEVNPRLTTSYVGLRQSVTLNLAEVMLGLAPLPTQFPIGRHRIQFLADGSCWQEDNETLYGKRAMP